MASKSIFRKLAKYTALATANAAAAFVLASAYTIHKNTARQKNHANLLDDFGWLDLNEVVILAEDGIRISAWLFEHSSDKIVILLPGRGNNRSESLFKAQMYIEQGYSVLMPDLRGTGSSEGRRISFGWQEQKDLVAWYYYLRTKGFDQIGAHGYSLGAATICYSLDEVDGYHFIILESCYPELSTIVKNSLIRARFPSLAVHLMIPITSRLVDYDAKEMYPIKYLPLFKGPIFVMGGENDKLVPRKDIIRLALSSVSGLVKIYLFENGAHQNFSRFFPRIYYRQLKDFLKGVEGFYEKTMP